MRKQTIVLLLTAVMAVGGVLAQGVKMKPAVDEPAEKYFDPANPTEPCQDCMEEVEQSCQTTETPFPCICRATSGSENTNLVQAHLEVSSTSCVALYQISGSN